MLFVGAQVELVLTEASGNLSLAKEYFYEFSLGTS